MPVGFEDRIEFGSDQWITLAREFLRRAASGHDLSDARFSLCETFTAAPAHLGRPGNLVEWHVRIDGPNITAAAGAIADADLRIKGDYHAVLPISRTVYGSDAAATARAQRENAGRVGASAIEVSGTPPTGKIARLLSAMHDHLARRTIDNPDLTERIERQHLAGHVRDLEENGYTILKGAFSMRFADELRATILERMAENKHPALPTAMLLERGRIFEEAALHPWLMTLAEKLCGKGFLLAQLLGQRKGKGPGALGLHSDYNLIREPFPAYPQNCTSIWALEDFTQEAARPGGPC